MTQKIQFELVSPEAKLFAEPVALAALPGTEGQFAVGEKHTSLVASLQAGVVYLYGESQSDTPRKIFITGGFADVTPESCTVLAEEAIDVATMNAEALAAELAQLREDLTLAEEQADRTRIQRQIDLAAARLEAATGERAAA